MADPKWRIYYGDGSVFGGDPYAAPTRNVQIVVVADPEHGWTLLNQHDYYWYMPVLDTWRSGDLFGLFDYLLTDGPKRVLFGRTLTRAEFQAVYMRACAEWTKTARYADERVPS